MSDAPLTNSEQFWFADDSVLVRQGSSFDESESILFSEVIIIADFLSSNTTGTSSFHLNNRESISEHQMQYQDSVLK